MKCNRCGKELEPTWGFCMYCGAPVAAGNQQRSMQPQHTHVHEWVDATCTSPKKCRTCGATEGEPLGHWWYMSSKTKDVRCVRNNCSCVKEPKGTSGLVRTMHNRVDVKHYMNVRFSDGKFNYGSARILEKPVMNCNYVRFSTNYTIDPNYQGGKRNVKGEFRVWGRGLDGVWVQLHVAQYDENTKSVAFELTVPMSLDAFLIDRRHNGEYSMTGTVDLETVLTGERIDFV